MYKEWKRLFYVNAGWHNIIRYFSDRNVENFKLKDFCRDCIRPAILWDLVGRNRTVIL